MSVAVHLHFDKRTRTRLGALVQDAEPAYERFLGTTSNEELLAGGPPPSIFDGANEVLRRSPVGLDLREFHPDVSDLLREGTDEHIALFLQGVLGYLFQIQLSKLPCLRLSCEEFEQRVNLMLADSHEATRLQDGKWVVGAIRNGGVAHPRDSRDSRDESENKEIMATTIFISHSNKDAKVAEALTHLLEGALEIPQRTIVCTSVPGYELQPGDHHSLVLRDAIKSSKVVIGLLTAQSIASGYVVMELGAAWGLEVPTAPLLHPSLDFKSIPGPLAEKHAVKADKDAGIFKLIETVSSLTNFPQKNTPKVAASVTNFLTAVRNAWPVP